MSRVVLSRTGQKERRREPRFLNTPSSRLRYPTCWGSKNDFGTGPVTNFPSSSIRFSLRRDPSINSTKSPSSSSLHLPNAEITAPVALQSSSSPGFSSPGKRICPDELRSASVGLIVDLLEIFSYHVDLAVDPRRTSLHRWNLTKCRGYHVGKGNGKTVQNRWAGIDLQLENTSFDRMAPGLGNRVGSPETCDTKLEKGMRGDRGTRRDRLGC